MGITDLLEEAHDKLQKRHESVLKQVCDMIDEYACNPDGMSLKGTAEEIIKVIEASDES